MRELVEKHFSQRKELLKINSHLNVVEGNVSSQEKEALKFLYAYMPISDIADYKGQFFLNNVKTALKAKDEFSWGKIIPNAEFMHFVLPYRVNNENLDTARQVIFKELKDRIKDKTLHDAVLEVNHWCHEKVTYKGTSIRTSAPLSTIRTAYGRCGEESTFTVTALRAVGIPARQVYTPRWAHCDDNHAWVEAWVDGQWYFLGACEPAPALDMGWFSRTSKRAMMVHTKAFGDYNGTERISNKTRYYTHLNTLSNYAPTKNLKVVVKDKKGNLIKDAQVQFGLYNYAEFYPIVKTVTDENGECNEITGIGDLLVWANKGSSYGYKKINGKNADIVEIVLNGNPAKEYAFDTDIVPPIEDGKISKKAPLVTKEMEKDNLKRLKEEDAIRKKYESTFMTKKSAVNLAKKTGFNEDKVWEVIEKSRGNWYNIEKFLLTVKDNKEYALKFLNLISDKDKRDTEAEVLISLFNNSFDNSDIRGDAFEKYVLNPRVRNELLTAYKSYFKKVLNSKLIKTVQSNPEELVNYIKENIKCNNNAQYYSLPILPKGVHTLKIADEVSVNIYFVSICRSLGIPARLEPGTEHPQYLKYNNWKTVNIFGSDESNASNKGKLRLVYSDKKYKDFSPKYYIHFTIAKFDNGVYKTLEYDWEKPLKDFPDYFELVPGHYRLVTGNRMEDGSVLSNITFFNISEGEKTIIPLKLRKAKTKLKVHGVTDLNRELTFYGKDKKASLKKLGGNKKLVMIWMDPDKEPTKHVIADIEKSKRSFEKWGGKLLYIVNEDKISDSFNVKSLRQKLPKCSIFCLDSKNEILNNIAKDTKKRITHYPVITVIDKEGKVIYFSMDYRIGLDEQILNIVNM
jgi:transglutaminase-like putative cysteine protease